MLAVALVCGGTRLATGAGMRCCGPLLAVVILTTGTELGAQEREGFVRVRIVAKRKVRLRKGSISVRGRSRVVCSAPCGRVIDARGGDLYFEGDGFPDSSRFDLDGVRGEVTARVEPGSWGLLVGGRVLEGFGAGVLVFGLVVLGAAVESERQGNPLHDAWKVGAPFALVNGAGLVFGGSWMVAHSDTTFTLERR